MNICMWLGKKKHRRGSPLQKSHCETEASADVIEQSPKSKKSGGERDPPDLPVPPDPRSKSKMKDLASEGDFVEAANTLPECPVLDDSIMDSNDSIPCGQADPDKVQKPDQPAIPEAMPPPVQIPVKILPSPRKGLKVLRPPTPPASSSADSADSDEEEEEEEGEQEEDESETEIEDVDLSSDDEYQFAPTATNPKMARCGSTSSTEKDEKSMKERRKKMYKKNPLRFWTSLQKELFTGVLGTDAKVSIRVPRICPVRGCGNLEDSPNKLFDHLIEKHLKTVRAFGEFPMSRRVENRSCAGPRVHSKEELDIGLKLLLVQHGLTSDQVQAVRSLIVDTCLGHLTTYGDEGSRPYRTVREMDVDVQSAAARQRIRYKTVVDHDLARKAKKAKV
ncbi:hypothetical protein ONE63_003473 [Megalurothrips usitatus]|uniref:Uncharacterized protein n=1 Tax=Megalurothrips usitatus TaxID=439358 RepID=A0AAV7XAC3_9NEOP|nr:hypothetical protein ONE63_003473 [Megalurothrips usitatus]